MGRSFGTFSLVAMALLTSAACAAPQAEAASGTTKLGNGNPAAPPSFGALPEVAKAASPRVRVGLGLARQVLEARFPDAPSNHSYVHLKAWIDRDVSPWVSKRRDSVDETRFEFGLQDNASVDDAVVGRAVLGLLDEDTALSLTRIPQPTELDNEPEIAQMFRELVRTQSAPFRSAALSEYRSCADEAHDADRDMQRWAAFCHARFARLLALQSEP